MNNNADIIRLISNLIRIGEVIELQATPLAARVKIGDNETDWITIAHRRAGTANDFDPPSIGEQVILFSPSGDLSQAILFGSLYSDNNDQPAQSLNEFHRQFSDGTFVNYNSDSHHLNLTVKGDLTVSINGNVSIEVNGDAAVTAGGKITADANAIELNGGAGVVTGNHICAFTGSPHSHCSSTVSAGE